MALHEETNESSPLLEGSMEKNIGISQQTLVSTTSEPFVKGKRFPQYAAGLASTLGALAAGMVLSWTSGAGDDGVKIAETYGISITPSEFSLISSFANLGAAAICVPIGILADMIGRKTSMLMLTVPFTIGWLLIIFASNVEMLLAGRFITGMSGGAFCVTAPMYSAEIAENEIRGRLGSYFQLLLTAGILLTYILVSFVDIKVLSIISAVVPIIFFVVFFFMPETPAYYLKKGNDDAARLSLIRLRGSRYDIETELNLLRASQAEASRSSFRESIRTKATKKALVIAFGLMFFQQLSGVNAIIFYSNQILGGENLYTIIFGLMQVVAVFISTLIVDKLGRKFLLIAASITMFLTTLILGTYYYLVEQKILDPSTNWIALVSVCVFIILFSFGFGPIPWMMMGEIFAPEAKGIAASSACLFNWLMAFVVTKTFSDIVAAIGSSGAFWIFSVVCAIGIAFVAILVPETKGKSLDDIQRELNN